jgi:hypothetical protein
MTFAKQSNTAGGLAKLYVLRLADYQGIKYMPAYNSFVLNDVSSALEEIYLTQDTISYSVTRKSNAYQVKISGTYPGSSDNIEELEGTPFILVGLTHNKEYLLFGDANNYFVYDYNQDGGANFEDLAQTSFELTRSMMLKPRLIYNPFIEQAEEVVTVDYSIILNGDDQWADMGEGYYIRTYASDITSNLTQFYLNQVSNNGTVKVSFEMKQNFSSGNFAPVLPTPCTYFASNAIVTYVSSYDITYSEQIVNEWITVELEVSAKDGEDFDTVIIYTKHADATALSGETIEFRNIVVELVD